MSLLFTFITAINFTTYLSLRYSKNVINTAQNAAELNETITNECNYKSCEFVLVSPASTMRIHNFFVRQLNLHFIFKQKIQATC